MATTVPKDRIGVVLAGRYRLDAVLGRGGMGVVYRATHTGTGRAVAIKLLAAGVAEDPVAAERFRREARAATKLQHPHVVEVLDMGTAADGAPFMALELLQGDTLEQHLLRESVLTPRQILEIVLPIMSAVSAAHQGGLVHRDLKPANIFLHRANDGRVVPKLLDFGIVKDLSAPGDSKTKTGVILGSPYFMAPEQVEGEPVGPATDVWAIGVVLYRALSGHLPFAGDNNVAVMVSIATGRYTPLHKIAPSIPFALAEVIEHAMRVSPAARYRDMAEFLAALEQVSETIDLDAAGGTVAGAAPRVQELADTHDDLVKLTSTAVRPKPEPIPARSRSSGSIAVSIAALAAIGAAAFYATQHRAVDVAPTPTPTPAPTAIADAAVALVIETSSVALAAKNEALSAAAAAADSACEKGAEWRAVQALISSADLALAKQDADSAKEAYRAATDAAKAIVARCQAEQRVAETAVDSGVVPAPDAAAAEAPDAAPRLMIVEVVEEPPPPPRDHRKAKEHYQRALDLKTRGDKKRAIAELDKAIKVAPDFVAAINTRAILHQSTGDISRAIADFDRALELDPKNASLYNNRGLARQAHSEHFAAAEDFSSAIDLDPRQPLFYLHRAAVRSAMGRRDLAAEDYTKVIELEPSSADAYWGRGIAREDLREHHEAIADFTKVLELDPRRGDAYYQRGRALAELGKNEDAIRDFTAAITKNPKHAMSHLRRGIAYSRTQRIAEARADILRFLELDPRSSHAATARAELDRLGRR